MAELLDNEAKMTPATYAEMHDSLRAAIGRGSVYIETAGIGAWEKITVHPEDPTDIRYFFTTFVPLSTDGTRGPLETSVDFERFEGVFRRAGCLRGYAFMEVDPQEIQVKDKLALRQTDQRIVRSLKVARLTCAEEALTVLEPQRY